VHVGILHEAGDKERIKVCEAYDVSALPMGEHYRRWYGSTGDNMYEMLKNTSVYKNRGFRTAGICSKWLSTDIPFLLVPFAQLADLAGVSVPVHRGLIEIAGALSKENFWETGFTLEKLGLDNLTVEEIKRYVTEGRKN
jgi:opine dehydrogenase